METAYFVAFGKLFFIKKGVFDSKRICIGISERTPLESVSKLAPLIYKEGFETMIKRDPEMHRGLLEVAEMFRKRDKPGLVKNMKKYLPHMDAAEIEDFIIGDYGTEGIHGQLIRLGSGRDYKGKIEMIKKLEKTNKLRDFDVEVVKVLLQIFLHYE